MVKMIINIEFHTYGRGMETEKDRIKIKNYFQKRIEENEIYQRLGKKIEMKEVMDGPLKVEEAKEKFQKIKESSVILEKIKETSQNKQALEFVETIQNSRKGIEREILEKLKNEKQQEEICKKIIITITFDDQIHQKENEKFYDEYQALAEVYQTRYKCISRVNIRQKEQSKNETTFISNQDRLLHLYDQLRDVIRDAKMPGGDFIMLKYPFKDDTFDLIDLVKTLKLSN